jgi:hypothetical protein
VGNGGGVGVREGGESGRKGRGRIDGRMGRWVHILGVVCG